MVGSNSWDSGLISAHSTRGSFHHDKEGMGARGKRRKLRMLCAVHIACTFRKQRENRKLGHVITSRVHPNDLLTSKAPSPKGFTTFPKGWLPGIQRHEPVGGEFTFKPQQREIDSCNLHLMLDRKAS